MLPRSKVTFAVGLVALLMGVDRLAAQSVTLEELVGNIDSSVLTNLDLSLLPSFTGLDEQQLRTLCRELQRRLQGEYVLDLAPLREMANALLPVLDKQEDLKPYAAWLRTRLDYLAVADELRVKIPPPSPDLKIAVPSQANPSAEAERQVWREHLKIGELSGQPDLTAGARLYSERLKTVFREEGVPTELVWLAEVESGFDPRARSPMGAAGLFQLMPDTAEIMGLTLSPRDERFDPLKSARSSAQYLKYLYGKFGDWRLTMAAYNAGEGTVRRLLEKHRAHTYDAIAVDLPAETQLYVPKIEAVILRRTGVFLSDLRPPRNG
jgi:membrane-bound lytic murein transglycosylase D